MWEWRAFTITRSQLNLLAGSVLFLTLVASGYQWWEDWRLLSQPIAAQAMATVQSAKTTLLQITDAHIFGGDISKDEVPLSNMQIQITGIVKTPNQRFSKVYLSVAGRPSKVYSVGDTINGSVLIEAIDKDYVLFKNNGRLEKLMLQRSPLEFKSLPAQDGT